MARRAYKLALISAILAGVTQAFGLNPALAQAGMTDCKTSILGALEGPAKAPQPEMMPKLKPNAPMPTGMAKDTAMMGDVGDHAAVQDKCLDSVLTGEESIMDKKK